MSKTKTKNYKLKTPKSVLKRFKITGTGKVTRAKRSHRNQRFSRGTNTKDTNTERKNLELSKSASKKVIRVLGLKK